MGQFAWPNSLQRVRVLCVGLIALVAFTCSAATARADPAWERALKHTESVLSAYEEAKKALEEAKKKYAAAKSLYDDAKKAYDAVKNNPEAAAAAAAGLAAAAKALGIAGAAVAAATKALAVATAAAAGFLAGTGYHQLGAYISHLCWDPVCDVVAVNPGSGPIYTPLTEAEIDAALPNLLLLATGERLTKRQFDTSPAGRTAWGFMAQAVRLFVESARGAAAANAGRHAEVLQAATSLQLQLRAIPTVMLASADALEATKAVPGTTMGRVSRALKAVDKLGKLLKNASKGSGGSCLSRNCKKLLRVTNRLEGALRRLRGALGPLLDSAGQPRSLGGDNGFFKIGSREEFRAFVQDCRTRGEACLPVWEVTVGNELLRLAGVRFRTGSLAAGLAEYDANPAGREEAALFDATGSVTHATMLRISATVLSDRGSWLNINLEESPLVIAARCVLQGVGCQPPPPPPTRPY